ncbi:MAG: PAS domain S-box protein [Kiritimatiellae bacterium]|nr:PAS domain S-box protein [Kiritimatiellia bacterium]
MKRPKRAKPGIEPSRRLLDRAFASLRDAILVIDADTGEIADCNPAASGIFGYARDELIGRTTEFLHADAAAFATFRARLIPAVEQHGRCEGFECPMKRKDGAVFPTEQYLTPLEGDNQARIGWVSVVRDISDRHKAKAAVQDSEADYRLIFDSVNDGIVVLDPETGRVTDVNAKMCEMLGFPREELLRPRPAASDRRSGLYADFRRQALEWLRTADTQAPRTVQWQHVHRSGRPLWIEANIRRVAVNGRDHLLAVVRDITERRWAQEELDQSRQFLQSVFDGIQDGICVLDSEFTIVRTNVRMEEMYAARMPLVGKKCYEACQSREQPCPDCPAEKVFDSGKAHSAVEPFRPAGDKPAGWIDLSAFPLKDADGNVIGVIEHIRDITQRRRVEEALRESEEKFRNLAEQSPNMIFINQGGRVVYANRQSERTLGYTREEFYAPTFDHMSIIAPKDHAMIRANFARHLRSEDVEPYEYALLAKDGREIESIITTKLISFAGQTAILGIVTDITPRKAMEQALRESEGKFRYLVENMRDVIYAVDLHGVITYASPAAELLLDSASSEIVGRHFIDFFHPEDASQLKANFARILAGERVTNEYRVRTRAGETRWILTSSQPKYEGARLTGVQGILTDITQRKEAEAEAEFQRQQLVQADKMVALGTLVSGVAHEVNNPAHFIMLNAPVLSKIYRQTTPIIDEHVAEHGDFRVGARSWSEMRETIPRLLDGILNGARRIKGIVDDLKGFARREPAQTSPDVDLNAVVRAALGLLQSSIKRSTRVFRVEYGRSLPPLTANARQLEQVVINLVQNACEALTNKEQAIRVATRYDRKARLVKVSVRDEGRGIPDAALNRVLDPFFTTKQDCGGTGLGLSVSARIVQRHGGKLEFKSKEGEGTTAVLSLPLGEAAAEDRPPARGRKGTGRTRARRRQKEST